MYNRRVYHRVCLRGMYLRVSERHVPMVGRKVYPMVGREVYPWWVGRCTSGWVGYPPWWVYLRVVY